MDMSLKEKNLALPGVYELMKKISNITTKGRVYKVENSKADTLFGGQGRS